MRPWQWLARRFRYPGQFDVIKPFLADATISGERREFKPGDTIFCEAAPAGPTVTFESERTSFIVGTSVFETCCRWKNAGA